jgi:adenosylmethionine-8-amino-7-oxononanoate aminotransferase
LNTDFLKYQAQTSPYPLGMEISHAKVLISATNNKKILRFCSRSFCVSSGISLRVNQAIKDQLDKYSHVMVYGEYSQSPAVEYCKLLASLLPESLDKTYLVNSGTEAIEGALKLARRYRSKSIDFLPQCLSWKHGFLSIMGWRAQTNFSPINSRCRFYHLQQWSRPS